MPICRRAPWIIGRSSIFDTAVGNVCKFKPPMTMAATSGVPRWRTMPASFVTAVQTSIAEPDRGKTVKGASTEQILALGVRSNQDPTTTAPPQS